MVGLRKRERSNFPFLLLRVVEDRSSLLCLLSHKMPKQPSQYSRPYFVQLSRVAFSCLASFLSFPGRQVQEFSVSDEEKRESRKPWSNHAKAVIKASLVLYTLLHHLRTATTRASSTGFLFVPQKIDRQTRYEQHSHLGLFSTLLHGR